MAPVPGEFADSLEIIDLVDAPRTASSPSQPTLRDLTGQVLASRYQLLDVVGGGGMGTVYRATDTQANREVAVKVLDPRFDPSRDPAFRERFLREARLSTRLSHGNIVEVLDTGESEGVHFIAMELLHGHTLGQLLETEKVLAWERVVKLVRQMCAGLAFAHELGLVHRDLKPANCFVLGEGATEWVKLLDFGLAKPMLQSGPADEEVTRTSVVMGSPTYMAPEQARGEASVETDIYAMGVMLYRMLSGQVPFVGRTAIDVIVNHIQTPLPWLEEVSPGHTVPIELELVMRRCLEKDPKSRYPSVQALVDALDAAELDTRRDPAKRAVTIQMAAVARRATPANAAAALAPQPPSGPLFASSRSETRRSGRGALVGAVVFGLALLGGFLAWRATQSPASAAELPGAAAAAVDPNKPEGAAAPGVAPGPETAGAPAAVPGPVTFRINSIPTGATVKVGTRVVGTTPAIFKVEPEDSGEATAELTLELKGYQAITFIATSPGPRFDLTQRLQKGTGKVQLPRLASSTSAEPEDEAPLFVPVVIPPGGKAASGSSAAAPAVVPPGGKPAPAPAPVVVAPRGSSPASAALAAAIATPPSAAPAPVVQPKVEAAVVPAAPVPSGVVPAEQLTTRARQLSAGEPPKYSEAARAANAEGTAVARCVVTAQGKLDRCRMMKSVALMDEAILESLKTRVYEPAKVRADVVASEISIVLKVQKP
jgi:serine/threonine-protein kinase